MSTREQALAKLTAPGAPFEIRTEDVRGEALPVFAGRQRCLGELLRASTAFGEADYLVTEHGGISFAEHHAAVAALATGLREEYGVGRGDRVALCAANGPEWIIAFWATVALGAVAVGMNSMWAGDEIGYGLSLTRPVVLVADERRAARGGASGIPLLSVERDLPALVAKYRGAGLPSLTVDEDDPAVILFTSGTTGRAKGATHSHRNVIAACWFHLLNDAIAAELGHPQAGRRFLLATPLFHIAALHNLAVVRLAVGDTAVIHLGKFDIDRVVALIEQERVTNWGAVPTMVSRLVERLEQPGGGGRDLSSLRTISVGSAPSSPALKQRLRAVLPSAGKTLGTTYGLTESSTAATLASAAELRADPDTVGRPVPTMSVEIRGTDGRPVAEGTEGEIWLRGPQLMLGYWGDPEATEAASAPHGWFRTGDLGTMSGGALRVSSRRSDLILRGAENVYPAEVETQLAAHPSVRECIVLGLAHPDLGQEVGAVVVLRAEGEVSETELREHLLARLARYKVPSRWLLTTRELPRNATGKVERAKVRLP
ncbi:fatty acid--CoA ligase [Prauserella marina]|uniref:Acyl-CoA synthetase (AMP-forming)/AMP-acid ligase II n=1 Tax=Prauserella marina TaxID=530584 RepID=A0A222VQY8_9PSEU|nr:AMP-binding protein [Prauserella marina]ASR36272.1 fatty acid--CoA ligase [Prauserella marina]PWV77047.1 acyl-CoA synthetase (AMP-forming)/AMP-acid ligase II [Prauserella marina]SDD03150.1 Acyl-CoA synthetase (AMP-forming)/AMP-acid ligase II [Prauserella marina]